MKRPHESLDYHMD